MNCPVCHNEPMIVLELKGVEIDYCLNCRGIWLDSGELELLIGNDEETKEFLSSFVVIDTLTTERKVKCPICSKKMEKILVGDENKVRIDKCRNNDGLWFDSGELEEVLKISKLGKNDDKILVLLRDIFGQKRS